MEEKKLTDEEIVKALKVVGKETLAFAYDKEQKQFKYVTAKEILDLIHRLQEDNKNYDRANSELMCTISEQKAEIERLTEELDLANETIDRNNKRYKKVSIERQKALDRVDFLEDALLDKIRRNEELITAIKQAEQQAVKDTAKEILQGLEERKERVKAFYGTAESVGADIAIRAVKEIVKCKGVEVE